jgi:hypothetical protein
MNTINTNGPRTTTTTPVDDPTTLAALAAAQAPAVYQPYVLTDGPPPEDNSVLPTGAYTAGLPPPERATVQPEEIVQLAADMGAMIAMNPSSTSEAAIYATMFAMQDLLIRLMMQLRTDNLKNRDNEVLNFANNKELAIQKFEAAAKLELAAGIAQGLGQIASGLMSTVGGFKGEGLQGGTIAVGKFTGFGSIAMGIGTITSASLTYASNMQKAAERRADLEAELATQRMNQSNERAANARESFLAVLQSQQAIVQTNADANKRVFA